MSGRPFHQKPYGFVEWFRPGEYEWAEETLPGLLDSGASFLRTHVSWAEYLAPGGEEWFDWLIPKIGPAIDLLPCIHYTPPSMSRTGKTSGPPHDLKAYADFVDHVLTRYGRHFEHIELWNEPNNLLDWDWRLDTDFQMFCEMVGGAAYWAQKRGWKTVLGGPSPFDPYWLNLMGERGVLGVVDAVGFHGFPGTWESEENTWAGWDHHMGEMRNVVERYNQDAAIWITEAGYSTWRNGELEQVRHFVDTMKSSADRLYWYGWRDIPGDVAVQEGHWFDPRHYHLGVVDRSNRPKLLARLLTEGGPQRLAEFADLPAPAINEGIRPMVISGGCGFIGANLADSLLSDGEDVVILDNLSRLGVDQNLHWLKDRHGDRAHPFLADVRDLPAIENAFADAKAVFHFAGQTAVTTSLTQPLDDFEINARGTINVLEAVRRSGRRTPVIFSSTNKVYGSLEDIRLVEEEERYTPQDDILRRHGVAETRPLDFHTPYGCSKGAADQYVLDYARSHGIPTGVLRMSCIYGERQFGTEDQGWVAHFLLQALSGEPITIFGDGKQVRDILEIGDAVRAYRLLLSRIEQMPGRVFNLGGGPQNAVSLLQLLREIGRIVGHPVDVRHEGWREGDQLYFVADTRKLTEETGWQAQTEWRRGIRALADWLRENRLSGGDREQRRRAAG